MNHRYNNQKIAKLKDLIWSVPEDKLLKSEEDLTDLSIFSVLSMTLSGACAFLIYLVSSSTANLLVSMGFGLVSTMGFNALDALGVELFPTHLRLDFASLISSFQYRVILIHLVMQLGWVDFHLDVPPSCPAAQPFLPNSR